jgi:mRNA interferase MazF
MDSGMEHGMGGGTGDGGTGTGAHKDYVPRRGDIVWVQMQPRVGHEQAGRRPALIVSPHAYNGKVGLALMCPITSRAKGYPFEVPLPADAEVTGVILSDQVKSLDWRARRAEFACQAPSSLVQEVQAKLHVLLA